jgi:acyl CoA:acetate/3-ketoacid CoA transferase
MFAAGRQRIDVRDGTLRIDEDAKVAKFVPEVDHVTLSGRMAREQGQQVTIVTERCVMRLRDEGLTVTEIAPGVDLERDVLARVSIPLRVSDDLRAMDGRLFRPEPMRLALEPRLERARPAEPVGKGAPRER